MKVYALGFLNTFMKRHIVLANIGTFPTATAAAEYAKANGRDWNLQITNVYEATVPEGRALREGDWKLLGTVFNTFPEDA